MTYLFIDKYQHIDDILKIGFFKNKEFFMKNTGKIFAGIAIILTVAFTNISCGSSDSGDPGYPGDEYNPGGNSLPGGENNPGGNNNPSGENNPGGGIPSTEITVLGDSLQEKLNWISRNAQSNVTYIVYVDKDETLYSTANLYYTGKVLAIKLRGNTHTVSGTGCLFQVQSGVTLLVENIYLESSNVMRVVGGRLEIGDTVVIRANNGNGNLTGVYIDGGLFNMNGGTIEGNSSMTAGYGVQINKGTFTMNSGTIKDFRSTSGAVYVNNGTFTMNGGAISNNNNYTGYEGGGAYVSSTGTFIMNAGTISNNRGRGVCNNGIFTMNQGTISGGFDGVKTIGGGTFTLINGEISGCSYHGVCVGEIIGATNYSGKFIMDGGIIKENGRGGVYVESMSSFTMNSGTISDNRATNGGGVYVNGYGSFTMHGGTISGNDIDSYIGGGGGVYVNRGSFTMNNGTISGNRATNGGGVYVNENSSFTIHGGTISGNTASASGGGVFSNYHICRIVTGTIYGNNEATVSLRNTATSGAALYKQSGTAVEYGTFTGTRNTWNSNGFLLTTDNTIKVQNGVIVP
jgi:hypothetical protein